MGMRQPDSGDEPKALAVRLGPDGGALVVLKRIDIIRYTVVCFRDGNVWKPSEDAGA